MADERIDPTDGGLPTDAAPAGDDPFVETLALFLRTVPVYPDGHKRVEGVAARLVDALARLDHPRAVEVTRDGLATDGCPVDAGTVHAKSVRRALHATAVARVTFAPDAPVASLVALARALGRNARLAARGDLSFQEIWAVPMPGVLLEEQLFSEEGFAGGESDDPSAPSPPHAGAGAKSGGGSRASSSSAARTLARLAESSHGQGGDTVGRARRGRDVVFVDAVAPPEPEGVPPPPAGGDAPSGARPLVRRTVSKGLRERIREHPVLGPRLARIEEAWAAREAGRAGVGRFDLLEHLLRALPIEARLDPEKGLRIAARVIDGLEAALVDLPDEVDPGPRRSMVLLLDAVRRVFPGRLPGEACPMPEPAAVAPAVEKPDEEEALLDYLERYLAGTEREVGAPASAPEEPPRLDGESGIAAIDGILLHAFLSEGRGARRDLLHASLVRALQARRSRDGTCLVRHLKENALDESRRDLASLSELASLVEESGLQEVAGKGGWIPLDLVLAMFPRLLGAYVMGGGSAGEVCRRVGRTDVLAASPALVGAKGPLQGEVVDRLLDQRSPDSLPLYEVLVETGDVEVRRKVLHAVRKMRLAYPAARTLSALPDAFVSPELLRGVCADGFEGQDSGRYDEAAVEAVGSAVQSRDVPIDARAFAVSALAAFDRLVAEPVVRRLLRRRWLLGVEAPDVRRAAKSVLERWLERERAMALAREDVP